MRKLNLRNFGVVALAGLIFVLVPASARADFLDFTVVETTVPGTIPNSFTADKLNGGYAELLSFTSPTTFTSAAYADFGEYRRNEGTILVPSQLNGLGANGYGLYATFTASGFASGGTSFTGTGGILHIYIDPNQDTTKSLPNSTSITLGNTADDYEIMYSTTLTSAVGLIQSPTLGVFDFTFGDLVLTNTGCVQCGTSYWPTLTAVKFTSTVDGDMDVINGIGTPQLDITGDVSAVFTAIPEPGTLTLFGLGLVGTALAMRRNRKNVK